MTLALRIALFFFLLNQHSSLAQIVERTMLRIPDTGLNTGYTSTFGEDNDFLINIPFFTINGDGTVTDTITGLMWQQVDGGEMTIEQAFFYCDTLTLAGYSDWRLPSAHESFSILNHLFTNPALNPSVFHSSNAEYWWTSDRQWNDSSKIWVTNAGGGIGNHLKSETISAGGTKRFHVRAVRQPLSAEQFLTRYLSLPDGTILDQLTGLNWNPFMNADSLTWKDALIFADSSVFGGHHDWRIPNIKELQSLTAVTFGNPSIDRTVFTNIITGKYWSSTTLPNQTAKAWYLDTQFGITTYQFKTNQLRVLTVRGESDVITELISLNEKQNISIFPNPANEKLCIFDRENSNYKYKIVDATGRCISSGTTAGCIETDFLSKGMYYLTLEGKQEKTFRFIK